MKTEFVANVSHELRTPLTSVAGYTELLADGAAGPLNAEQADMVAVVESSTLRLAALIEDLLTLNRIDADGFESRRDIVDVSGVAEVALHLTGPEAQRRGVALDMTTADAPTPVVGDADQLRRVLLNLLGNAVKFTSAGGVVSLGVAVDRGEVAVTVSDSGTGIPPEDVPHVFSRFFRAGNATAGAIAGTGLGLAIAKSIVDQHDGTIAVASELGRGTVVTVRLPTAGIRAA
jgi:two-component system phosphate regulon sensor histidine kinase PhoR